MKPKPVLLIVLGTLVLTTLCMNMFPSRSAAQAPKSDPLLLTVRYKLKTFTLGTPQTGWEEDLNKLGAEGWKLQSTVTTESTTTFVFAK